MAATIELFCSHMHAVRIPSRGKVSFRNPLLIKNGSAWRTVSSLPTKRRPCASSCGTISGLTS